jgi:hypothetical protein
VNDLSEITTTNGKEHPQTARTRTQSLTFEQQKWQTQTRQFISNWTPQQMDAYLAIPEVALEWNVEPGNFTFSCAASLQALQIGSRMVLTDVVF